MRLAKTFWILLCAAADVGTDRHSAIERERGKQKTDVNRDFKCKLTSQHSKSTLEMDGSGIKNVTKSPWFMNLRLLCVWVSECWRTSSTREQTVQQYYTKRNIKMPSLWIYSHSATNTQLSICTVCLRVQPDTISTFINSIISFSCSLFFYNDTHTHTPEISSFI